VAVITRRRAVGTATVSVTFGVRDARDATRPVSVVGDFNGWDPSAHPLQHTADGPPRTTVRLQAGRVYRFRYRTDTGHWFDDEAADGYEPNGYGQENCLLDLVNSIG
jgi:1,4-alpha-glucan branching enzyme